IGIGAQPPDSHRRGCPRTSRGHNLYPGHLSLQGLYWVGRWCLGNLFGIHRDDGTGQIGLALGSIPDHDHLIELLQVFLQADINGGPAPDGNFLVDKTNVTELQNSIFWKSVQTIVPVKIGLGPRSGTLKDYTGPRQGLAQSVRDRTRDRYVVLGP